MRDKITSLINENGAIRDEIYHIASKLYQVEQENLILKADLRRNTEQFPISYLQEQLREASRHNKSEFIPTSESRSHLEEGRKL
jgi:ABC-type enterochelin transport system ATPase subunit